MFEVGDIVVLKTGAAPQEVIDVMTARDAREGHARRLHHSVHSCAGSDQIILTHYISSSDSEYNANACYRAASNYRHVDDTNDEKGNNNIMATIYKTKDDRYGTLLTKDSQGRYVLEIKGGDVIAFDKNDVEEVVPYTVDLKGTFTGAVLHYEAKEGLVAKGDLLLDLKDGFTLYEVTGVDTKRRKTRGNLADAGFRRLVTEKIS